MKVVLVRYRFVSKRRTHTCHQELFGSEGEVRCGKVNVSSTRLHGSSGIHCWKQTILAAGMKFTARKSSTYPQLLSFFIFMLVHKNVKREFCFVMSDCLSVCLSVCLSSVCTSVRLSTWNNSAPTGRIIKKFDI